MIKWGEKENFGVVTVDRNRMIKMIVEQMRDVGRIPINGTKEEWTEFASHFENIYRELVMQAQSQNRDQSTLYKNQYVWKRNGPDHFVHTLVYAMVGLDRYATQYGEVAAPSMFGELPRGRIIDNTQEFGF